MMIAIYVIPLAFVAALLWYERRAMRAMNDPSRLARIRAQLDEVRRGFIK